jgi:hypothetical protein
LALALVKGNYKADLTWIRPRATPARSGAHDGRRLSFVGRIATPGRVVVTSSGRRELSASGRPRGASGAARPQRGCRDAPGGGPRREIVADAGVDWANRVVVEQPALALHAATMAVGFRSRADHAVARHLMATEFWLFATRRRGPTWAGRSAWRSHPPAARLGVGDAQQPATGRWNSVPTRSGHELGALARRPRLVIPTKPKTAKAPQICETSS